MNISISDKTLNNSPLTVFPVVANAQLEQTFSDLEQKLEIPIAFLENDFKASLGEVQLLYSQGKRIYLLGLGKQPGFQEVLRAFRSFSFKYKEKLSAQISLHFQNASLPDNVNNWIEAAVNGLILGAYKIGQYKTTEENDHPLLAQNASIELFAPNSASKVAEKAASNGGAVAETQLSIFRLVNAPSNKKQPSDLANWAKKSGQTHGYQVNIFDKDKIEALGLDALLAVNRGSEHPPFFIVMEYFPKETPSQSLKKIGLVGKGVTFDTGGLSIKPSSNMHFMKSDMGGAAAVFGTMELAAKLQLPIHLFGIVPATDNSVDALSIKPSDVINSYSGKTIEIIDTDAEGRLILADGLSYMIRQFQPDILIDLATLTGSAVRTFGYHAAGLFSKNDELAEELYKASEQTGEKIWRLPMWDVYLDDIKSDVADVRNYSGRPMAGAIGAAKFLEFFTENHPAWAHLDIAGVAFSDSEFTIQKSATGFGVRLLLEYLKNLCK